ncbi:MAG: sugar kinase [Chloroflexaceae bacterium]|nr:sugar kinase [Chloroflexaceae bacterium]
MLDINAQGLFVGLATLDSIYLVKALPDRNQKIVALDQTIAAGGPAANAAVTFRHLGNQARLLTIIGQHSLSQVIRSDLETLAVEVVDLERDRQDSPPLSSILVKESTGERAVISLNAVKAQATLEQLPEDSLAGVDIVLIDGHQMVVGAALAREARAAGIPVVIDGGSWKPGFETVLPYVDYAICSANFWPPGCQTQEEVLAYLGDQGITHMAITQGERPILYRSPDRAGEIPVPQIQAVDTLAAGDIFHGAFSHYILQQDFPAALAQAAAIASYACGFFGSRQWLQHFVNRSPPLNGGACG